MLSLPTPGTGSSDNYAPEMHRVSRERYTLEVIRGLLG
jgi:hypothetical protein